MGMTVAEFALAWALEYPRPTRETQVHNEQMVRPFVEGYGGFLLDGVQRSDAQAFALEFPSHVRYARTMLRDAQRAGLIDRDPFEGVRVPRERRSAPDHVIHEDDVLKLAEAALNYYGGFFGQSFSGMIVVAAFSGLRLMEQARLEVEHCVPVGDAWELSVVDGKGRRDRQVLLAYPRAVAALELALLNARGGRLWRSPQRRPWTRNSLGRCFRPVRETAGVDVPWKMLRRFCASWMIDRGAEPIDVALALHGNTNPETVMRYYVVASRAASFERVAAVCS